MRTYAIGILGGADIAVKRFLPALQLCEGAEFAGVASRDSEKAKSICDRFGGKAYENYDALLADEAIDAVYLPLPPSLHFDWAMRALEQGKHVFLEKPATVSPEQAEALLNKAEQKHLAVQENYAFLYHSQLSAFRSRIEIGRIGAVQSYDIRFGFPHRAANDFRYDAAMGGGALLDCGGYCIRLASELLGESCRLLGGDWSVSEQEGVDLFGSALYENEQHVFAQVSFGMAHAYQCQVQVWGSGGLLAAPRIFTAPPDFSPVLLETVDSAQSVIELPPDNQFLRATERFLAGIKDDRLQQDMRREIRTQSQLVDEFRARCAGK
ncbi:MAG: Gfo/Idh/MocA family oxidoreductase [Christensenella sp.]|nr:Gfo/Idh/MocA family oxidoreductase [Christensenella sp.]